MKITTPRSWWPLLLALPPLAAMVGSAITVWLIARHPDLEQRPSDTVYTSAQTTAHP